MTITDYSRIQRLWNPRVLCDGRRLEPKYLYTMQPLRRVSLLDTEDEDPIVLIKRRVW
jgi:hypothetical protein